jgi:hypothetical protein
MVVDYTNGISPMVGVDGFVVLLCLVVNEVIFARK